ncbi:MAG TPA: IS1380 family transposase [Anaeromyxobacteraceae bacterium]|nr:IS1380 family transposase [Anaeromyxobacteraceae bacterium]
MTECSPISTQAAFSFFHPQRVTVTFDEGEVTTDAGVLLLRQLDDRLGLTATLARALRDWRNPIFVLHPFHEMVRERVFGIAQGYEDCNDTASLRDEPLFRTICRGQDDVALASQPTLSRFENRAAGGGLEAARHVPLAHFIERYKRRFTRPKRLVLDIDTTDDETHGQQELAFFNGHYGSHCYRHLLIHTEEGDLLFAALLPGTGDVRVVALAAVREVVAELREAFPGLVLGLRADNGFACPELYDFCEDHDVEYFVNVGTYPTMVKQLESQRKRARELFKALDEKVPVQVFGEFQYQAESWRQPRRVVGKAAHTLLGPDERFLVTNSIHPVGDVYACYAGRGQEENWIKDFKLGLKSGRLSCSSFAANELRLLLFAVAYQLLHELRRRASKPLRTLRLETLRLRLLRVAARVKKTARRLWVHVSESYPWRADWLRLARAVGATIT